MDIYQDNYTLSDYNLNIQKPETESINNGADNMNEENIKKGREFLDKFKSLIDNFTLERATNPEAYLLTGKESDYLTKAFNCYAESLARYTNPLDKSMLPPEVVKEIVKQTLDTFNRKGIKINKLRAFVNDKYNNSFYWCIVPKIEQATDNNEVIVERLEVGILVIIARDEKPQFIPAFKHPFFEAENIRARARALGLSDIYLFVDRYELNMLDILSKMFNYIDALKTPEQAPKPTTEITSFYSVVSNPIMNALTDTGANARKGNFKKDYDEQGRQISIFDCPNDNGINVQLEKVLPDPNVFLSVGDPNTDKLLLQIQLIAMQTGKQEFEIPIGDFMKFRGLSDRKSAIEKAEKAANNLDRCRLHIEYYEPDASLKGNIPYVQFSGMAKKPGRAGNSIVIEISNKIFRHIMKLSEKGQQIEQLDKNILLLPDNQRTAYNIARKLSHHVRFNAGKNNAHIIGVKTLIDCCSILPLYPDNSEDAGKDNYLRFPSEAPERIIKPFISGLNFITKGYQEKEKHQIIKNYRFKHKKGGALTDAELEKALKDYRTFTALNIEFELCNEPNYKNLIESKAKHAEAAEKAKQAKTSNKEHGKAAKKRTKTEPVKQEKAPEAKPIIPKKAPFENL